jgi:zinc transport system substrate-binding protein
VRRPLALLLVLPLLLSACTGSSADDRPTVVGGAYPVAWLVRQVVGEDVRVVDLVKPGVEPHDVELTPRQVGEIEQADAVIYLKGFQPAVDDAVKGRVNAYDLGAALHQLSGGEDGKGKDPHVWLDPVLMQDLARQVATDVTAIGDAVSPGRAVSQLAALDKDVQAQLSGCRSSEIVTSHAAFAYFAQRYGLTQRGITGLNPESEPSPKRLAEVASYAREHHVTTIFFESLVSPKVARTVASEVGARTAVLDPIESVSGSDDYLSVMRRNAATLHEALGCTG